MPDFTGSKLSYNEIPAGEVNGENREFTILHQPLPESLQVFKDGIFMHKGVDYLLDRFNKKITFSNHQVPQEESVIVVSYKHY